MAPIDPERTKKIIDTEWDATIVPALVKYIEIPNMSPVFDPEWATNGHQDRAIQLMVDWVRSQNVPTLQMEVVTCERRTPLIYIEIPATHANNTTVMMYGHMDKQPPFDGWEEGLGPWTPVIRDGKLYGRGGADDGYAIFSAVLAIKALKEMGVAHARTVILVEASEESGSPDLPYYVEQLQGRIGTPNLIVCLDSGCCNYDQMWLTTSLRGMCMGELEVQILKEGVHSGDASGIVPSSFRIARQVLNRLEDVNTGKVHDSFQVQVPEQRLEQIQQLVDEIGDEVFDKFPWVDGARPTTEDRKELVLNRTWRAQVSVTGADGFPPCQTAGNVLRPSTRLKLSVRLPPTISPENAARLMKELLERDPPYNSKVSFHMDKAAPGWDSPLLATWLDNSTRKASETYFGKPACCSGEGGSIPFMGMLGEKFPQAQFVITGVLGPNSNAHGPNEFLHIPYAKKLTCAITQILADHAEQQ
eukprot:GFYU01010324.1.p1 GENE.GFYU01010324.1~~GFYU01010324.1.p1  ORF type:complete len:474 (-),score=170.33 GFYU01010324.1:80-1501(-)